MTERDRERAIRRKLVRMSEPAPAAAIPTGFASLDAALRTGGLPRGRIVEIFGGSSSGKTTLALQIVAHAQSLGMTAAWIDADHTLDPSYAARLGVAIERMPVAQPATAEEALEVARQLADSHAVDVVVLDSAAALTPSLELESQLGEIGPGLQGRVLGSGLRHLAGTVSRSGALVLVLNQLRSRPDTAGQEMETSAGGSALKLYAAVRIALEEQAAGRVRFRIVKNKDAGASGAGELYGPGDPGFAKSP